MGAERQLLGKAGEDLAAQALRQRGYAILDRNYRCRYGEVDIIGKLGEIVVFIEVKTRSSERYGAPQEAVTARKQRQLAMVAHHFLTEHGLGDSPCRFDVVAVLADGHGPAHIEIIPGAFDLAAW